MWPWSALDPSQKLSQEHIYRSSIVKPTALVNQLYFQEESHDEHLSSATQDPTSAVPNDIAKKEHDE